MKLPASVKTNSKYIVGPIYDFVFFIGSKLVGGVNLNWTNLLYYSPKIYLLLFLVNALAWTMSFVAKETCLSFMDLKYFKKHPGKAVRNMARDKKADQLFSILHFVIFNIYVVVTYWPQ